MGEQIVKIFESFVRESIAVTVNGCVIVCWEIFKFYLMLLILHYFTLWSFRVLDQFPHICPVQAKLSSKPKTQPIVSETFLRIGAPDEKLIKQRASLLEQLEIEAEFEENIKQNMKSEKNMEIQPTVTEAGNSREAGPFKDLFISQIIYEPNETSQPTQTTKTSLGKKSMPKGDQSQANPTLIDQSENQELRSQINVETERDTLATKSTEECETPASNDEQKNL